MLQKFQRGWSTMPGNVRGSLIVVLACLVAVVMSSLIKQIGKNIPVVEILFIRQFLMLAIVSPVIIRDINHVFTTNMLPHHILRGLLSGGAMFTAFTAIVHIPLAEVTAISFIRTLFTAILAIIFLKELIGIRRWASIFVGFMGVVVIIRPDTANINIYAIYALASAFFVSGTSIVMRTLAQGDRPSTIMAYHSIFVTLGMGGRRSTFG